MWGIKINYKDGTEFDSAVIYTSLDEAYEYCLSNEDEDTILFCEFYRKRE